MSSPPATPAKVKRRWIWHKPADKPKRLLSAYDIFFADIRRELLQELYHNGSLAHGLGFGNLARTVSARWKTIDPARKSFYEDRGKIEFQRYQVELARWKRKHEGAAISSPEEVISSHGAGRAKTREHQRMANSPPTQQLQIAHKIDTAAATASSVSPISSTTSSSASQATTSQIKFTARPPIFFAGTRLAPQLHSCVHIFFAIARRKNPCRVVSGAPFLSCSFRANTRWTSAQALRQP